MRDSLTDTFQAALQAHLRGDHQAAMQQYSHYLGLCNHIHIVRTNIAAILLEKGDVEQAIPLLDIAIAEEPKYPEALLNRGFASFLKGELDVSFAYVQLALHESPLFPQAHNLLLKIFVKSNRSLDISQFLERDDIRDSLNIDTVSALARFRFYTSGLDALVNTYDHAVTRLSGDSLAHLYSSFATDLMDLQGPSDLILDSLEHAISLPTAPILEAYVNKGEQLRVMRRYDQSLDWCSYSLTIFPDAPKLLNLQGCLFLDLQQSSKAAHVFARCISYDSSNIDLLTNLSLAYVSCGSYSMARNLLVEAIEKTPNASPRLHQALAQVYFSVDQHSLALASFENALSLDPSFRQCWDNYLYFLSSSRVLTGSKLRAKFNRYASDFLDITYQSVDSKYIHHSSPLVDRPLKLGIVSAEIGSHCVSFFLQSLIDGSLSLDVQIFIFATVSRAGDHAWHHISSSVHKFFDISTYSREDSLAFIRSFNLDCILETTQHMSHNSLHILCSRAAPVQAHYIGMHGTTGAPSIDYFIGDDIILNPEFKSEFTEDFLVLPRTWVAYTPPSTLPPLDHSPAPSLRFGCFNNFSKITTETLDFWAGILRSFPSSTLLLKDSHGRSGIDSERSLFISSYLSKLGVKKSRILIASHLPSWSDHISLYNSIDIALDTFPLTSGTTAFDSLLMGTPLVPYSSDWIGGRLSSSIVSGLGHSDWISSSLDQAIAVINKITTAYSSDPQYKSAVRTQFLTSDLCDSKGLASILISKLKDAYNRTLC